MECEYCGKMAMHMLSCRICGRTVCPQCKSKRFFLDDLCYQCDENMMTKTEESSRARTEAEDN